MQFDKSQVLDLLRSQGKGDVADRADQELPGTVDTERDAGLLQQFGLTVPELIGALSGGGGVAGVAGRLLGAVGDDGKGKGGGLGGLLGK